MNPREKSKKSAAKRSTVAIIPAKTDEIPALAAPGGVVFPIVGIGASAGGLAAFEAFFSGMPEQGDPGMAFILVQHLAPDHESILAGLIQRHTRMQVSEAKDGMTVRVNGVYIIPPNRDMALMNGALHLLEPVEPRGHRLPIDFLFNSLAQDQHERAIGIVLSGTGSDGTQGVRAIKGSGGLVMAQNLASCEFDGMPRSALATGLVDFELPPAEMPARLMSWVAQTFRKPPLIGSVQAQHQESALTRIFIVLRTQTGHDFSQYKRSTLQRRIERRMAVHRVDTIDNYVKYLQQSPLEVIELFQDFLIGVTQFFRDTEAFKTFEALGIARVFEGKPAGSSIRVWIPACSTGEEAYSIAIVLQEKLETLKFNYKLIVFATDIDARAIATARAGLYPAAIAAAVSPERLARYFTLESEGTHYRVHKVIRQLLVFSEHDLIRDPPFSKLDLISCRNLLIYMDSALQKLVISLFRYALSPAGVLFLGTSETLGEHTELFTPLDRKYKLYQRDKALEDAGRGTAVHTPLHHLTGAVPEGGRASEVNATAGKIKRSPRLALRQLAEQTLLQQVKAVGALVNGQGDILYLHGRFGQFLEPLPGEAGISNILKMAQDGLRGKLIRGLSKVVSTQSLVSVPGVRVEAGGRAWAVDLSLCPVVQAESAGTDSLLYLVILQATAALEQSAASLANPPQSIPESGQNPDGNVQVEMLTEQLRARDERLHSVYEELNTSNEQLKSSNEEMQSINEELQSTNEELETSKEELQSINEELATVNAELQAKLTDLSRSNNDMNNLLSGTEIGTIFVDHELRILRFTPAAALIIKLIPGDLGRPLSDLATNLSNYDFMLADVRAVLRTLASKEIDVQTLDGKSYTARLSPYRTTDNVIEGAVISFVEITEVVRAREALRKANELLRLAVVVRDSFDAITVQDMEGRIVAWNPGAVSLYGWSEAEALQLNARDRIPAALQSDALAQVQQLSKAAVLHAFSTQRLHKNGSTVEISLISTALINDSGQTYAIATTERSRGQANA